VAKSIPVGLRFSARFVMLDTSVWIGWPTRNAYA